MSEQDQAMETLLGYAGRRASRELLAAVLVAPYIFEMTKSTHHMHLTKEIRGHMAMALELSDRLMKLSAELPPKT